MAGSEKKFQEEIVLCPLCGFWASLFANIGGSIQGSTNNVVFRPPSAFHVHFYSTRLSN